MSDKDNRARDAGIDRTLKDPGNEGEHTESKECREASRRAVERPTKAHRHHHPAYKCESEDKTNIGLDQPLSLSNVRIWQADDKVGGAPRTSLVRPTSLHQRETTSPKP